MQKFLFKMINLEMIKDSTEMEQNKAKQNK